ncbi:MAG: glycosyltransferase [Isosphaeraceae bacterium]|nr:glycosyltransferase [Isosphaeraceae bacterium]
MFTPDERARLAAEARARLYARRAALAPARATAVVAWPPAASADGRRRVGLAAPVLSDGGGAETWMYDLVRLTDTARLRWEGLWIENPVPMHPTRRRLEALLPIAAGAADEALRQLARRCDVLVAWALPRLAERIGAPRPPIVMVSHSPPHSGWAAETYPSWVADFDVAVSEVALGPIPEPRRSRARVIPNAIDPARLRTDRTRAEVRSAWGIPAEARVLGMLSRATSEKRPEALAATVAHLPQTWWGVGVGPGWDADSIPRHPRCVYPGPQHDVGAALRAFDALLSPSDYESFGYTLGEALLAGTPVIATVTGLVLDRPDLVRPIPVAADGATIAAAVLADEADAAATAARVARAQQYVATISTPDRFGQEWTEFLVAVAAATPATPVANTQPPPPPREVLTKLKQIKACPHRRPEPG